MKKSGTKMKHRDSRSLKCVLNFGTEKLYCRQHFYFKDRLSANMIGAISRKHLQNIRTVGGGKFAAKPLPFNSSGNSISTI
jgi:hypothetical protein